jgi:predicted DNA-binding protein with PD1-like motif
MTTPSTSPRPDAPRTLVHPGPFDPIRIRSMQAARARHVRLQLEPGRTLFDALVEPLYAIGIRNASTTILGGVFIRLRYCVAPADPSGQAVAAYTQPLDGGKSCMIFGNATLGKQTDGTPLVHCHAVVRTEAGRLQGGHILARHCTVGAEPISVLVTSLDGVELRVTYDAETNVSMFKPTEESHNA